MATLLPTQSATRVLLRAAVRTRRGFHSTRPAFIKVGDTLPPAVALAEKSPGNQVDLAEEAKRRRNMLIIGVPGAFSPGCSGSHIPAYMGHARTKDFDMVAVVAVNDAFVMKAWGDVLDPAGRVGLRFLADATGAFTRALGLGFDATPFFGGERSKRYALLVKDGKVVAVHVEPDSTGTDVSMPDKVFGSKA